MGRILIYYTLIRFSYDYMFYWRFFIISVSFKKCTVIWHFSDTWQIIIKMEKVLSVQKQLIQGLMNQIGWVSTTQEFTKMNKEAQFEAIRLVARPFSILRLPFMSRSGKFQGSSIRSCSKNTDSNDFSNGTAVECNDADECTERKIPVFDSELDDDFEVYENYRGKFWVLLTEFSSGSNILKKLFKVVETDNKNYALIVTCLNVSETQVGFNLKLSRATNTIWFI